MIIQLMLKHGAFKRLGVKMLIIQKNCVNSQRDFNSCPAMVMYAGNYVAETSGPVFDRHGCWNCLMKIRTTPKPFNIFRLWKTRSSKLET